MLTYAQKKYLFAIYKLSEDGAPVRSTEVSKVVGVSKASTVKMARRLAEEGYIEKAPYGAIFLTEQGIRAANSLYTDWLIVRDFLIKKVGLCESSADGDSVTIVSHMSQEAVEKLVGYALGRT